MEQSEAYWCDWCDKRHVDECTKGGDGWHVCRGCRETVYCEDSECNGLPSELCDECFLAAHYKHEKKTSQ